MNSQKKYKIFFAISDIGHLSQMNVKSLIEAMDYLYPNSFDYTVNDILSNGNTETGRNLGNFYKSKTARNNIMYDLAFKFSDMRLKRFIKTEDGLKMIQATSEKLKQEKPDIIVSLSTLINSPLFEAIKSTKFDEKIPTAMVYNTNSVKRSFIKSIREENFDFDRYIVISEHVRKDLIGKAKVESDRIISVKYPVKINFNVMPDELKLLEIKKYFDLPVDRRIGLFYGRQNGYKDIVKIVKKMLKNDRLTKNGFFIIMTRNNRKQYEELFKMVGDNMSFRVVGFSEQIYEYVAISDIMLCGANPESLKQAMLLKKPVIITNYSDKEEKENIDFVLHKGYGKYEKNHDRIVEELEELIAEHEELQKIKDNYKESNFENGTIEIAKELIELMDEYIPFEKSGKIAKRSAFLRNKKRT